MDNLYVMSPFFISCIFHPAALRNANRNSNGKNPSPKDLSPFLWYDAIGYLNTKKIPRMARDIAKEPSQTLKKTGQ
jgi:hypothetical protein